MSGSALYEVAGPASLIVAGCAELLKGAAGPLMVGRDRPRLAALAAAAAIVGHNWSPWINWKGGRGVSLVLGAGLVLAPEATALVGAGLAFGRLLRKTGAGTFVALVLLPVVLASRRGSAGAWIASAFVIPVLAKRLVGNENRLPAPAEALRRLVLDRS